MPVNRSERFVCHLCDRSFLEPWSYMNPMGPDGKELADAVISYENSIILVSVKEYGPSNPTDEITARKRWLRKAVESSIKQLRGAQRQLDRLDELVEPLSKRTLRLPTLRDRCVYLLSVSLGGSRYGRFGSRSTDTGFVHVLDDHSLIPHFAELDTLPEFLAYLTWRQNVNVVSSETSLPPEEDWLGWYLHGGKGLDQGVPRTGAFQEYLAAPEFERGGEADRASLFWDRMVLHLWSLRHRFMSTSGSIGDQTVPPPSSESMDKVLRQTVVHPRAERRFLGAFLLDLFAIDDESNARILKVPTGPGYVFQRRDSFENLQFAQEELFARCVYVQECLMPDRNIIGLASTRDIGTFHSDVRVLLCYLEGAVGTEEMRESARDLARKAGFFQDVKSYEVPHEEFGVRFEEDKP